MSEQIARGPLVREPRWPAFVAMVAAACVYWALPEPLSVGPGWGLLAVIFVLLIPTVISKSARRLPHHTDSDVYRERRDHDRDDRFAGVSDLRIAAPSRFAAGAAARGCGAVDHERAGVRAVVLEARTREARWCASERRVASKSSFLFPQMLAERRFVVVAALHGLPVSGVQHEHGVFADGYGGAVALGQGGDDGTVVDPRYRSLRCLLRAP